MKILYCINSTFNSGGMERILMIKANYFVRKGYEVVIVTTEQAGRRHFFPFSDQIKFVDLGINYNNNVGLFLPLRIILKWRKKVEHKKLLTLILQQEKPDIAISMFDYDFSILPKIKDGSKKILEFHFSKNFKVISTRNILLKVIQKCRIRLWKNKIKSYDCFVVLTQEDKKSWRGIRNIHVIHNCIPQIPFTSSPLTEHIVFSAGRITYQKGFDLLVQAWSLVLKKLPDWKLIICGGGTESDRNKLNTQIHSLGIECSVILKPATLNIAEEFCNASLYVMPSRYEGLPMVLIEAMSYGLPIVSFACPCGPKDIISEDFGTLVQPENIQQLADALIAWMSNDMKRKIGGQAARISAQRFLEENVMKQWEGLFDSLLKQK